MIGYHYIQNYGSIMCRGLVYGEETTHANRPKHLPARTDLRVAFSLASCVFVPVSRDSLAV